MNNDLRIPLAVSFALHLALFFAFSYQPRRDLYIHVPVDLMFYNEPAPQQKEEAPREKPIKKDEGIAVKPRNSDKKDAKPEPKPVPEVKQPGSSSPGPLRPVSQLTLESAKFPYSYYTNTVVKKINRNWQWSTEFDRLKTVVYFRITKTGALSEVSVKESSGDPLFDQQALRAVKLSDPLPPLPEGYEDDHLGIYFEFTFKR